MRIGALSRSSGVSVATIKFYVREGLLHAGKPTAAPNQVDYDDTHLRRLVLLRALVEVGGLSLSATRKTVQRLESPTTGARDVLMTLLNGVPSHAPAPLGPGTASEDLDRAAAQKVVNRLLRDRGWQDAASSTPVATLVQATTALSRLGYGVSETRLGLYADAAEKLVKRERVAAEGADGPKLPAAEAAVVDAVLFGAVLMSMRQLAQLRAADEPLTAKPGKSNADRAAKKRPKGK